MEASIADLGANDSKYQKLGGNEPCMRNNECKKTFKSIWDIPTTLVHHTSVGLRTSKEDLAGNFNFPLSGLQNRRVPSNVDDYGFT